MDIFFGKIDAEWMDPKTEMPPDGWYGMIIWRGVPEMRSAKWNGKDWQSADVEPFLYYKSEVVAWMRLGGQSDAIPREKVQALADMSQKRILQYGIVQASEIYGLIVQEIEHFTGVKPKEKS